MLVMVVGLPILAGTLFAARGFADIERLRIPAVLRRPRVRPTYQAPRTGRRGRGSGSHPARPTAVLARPGARHLPLPDRRGRLLHRGHLVGRGARRPDLRRSGTGRSRAARTTRIAARADRASATQPRPDRPSYRHRPGRPRHAAVRGPWLRLLEAGFGRVCSPAWPSCARSRSTDADRARRRPRCRPRRPRCAGWSGTSTTARSSGWSGSRWTWAGPSSSSTADPDGARGDRRRGAQPDPGDPGRAAGAVPRHRPADPDRPRPAARAGRAGRAVHRAGRAGRRRRAGRRLEPGGRDTPRTSWSPRR